MCHLCRRTSNRALPPLLGLKVVYQRENQATKQLCTLAPKIPWKPRAPGMTSNPTSQFTSYFPSQQYPPQCLDPTMPWKGWPQQQVHNHPWKQGW
jgi:hypothetical protein